jgi:hypothetical protein
MNFKDFDTKIPARTFIEKAFRVFNQVRNSKNGISELRLRRDQFCKKLIEEILPISTFLANFERPGLDLYCKYVGHLNNYSYDAIIYCEGILAEKGSLLYEYFLEVSIACHEKNYLKRECIEKGVPCFGGSAIKRKLNGSIKSSPEVQSIDFLLDEHIKFIKSRIQEKNKKNYPANTYLIIPLFPDTCLLRDEWLNIISKLTSSIDSTTFCGIFVYDTISYRKLFY